MFADVEARLAAGLIAPDLPGHGGRNAANTEWGDAVAEVIEVAGDLAPDVIVGYSMGGRLALNAALAAPEIAPELILISTSTGIADDVERANRRKTDAATATSLQAGGDVAEFLRSFHNSPMVQAHRSTVDLESIRLRMTRQGLVGALQGMGQGTQPFVGDRLTELPMNVTWIAGAEDAKYAAIAIEASTRCRYGSLVMVADSGHNVVAERPDAVAAAITAALS